MTEELNVTCVAIANFVDPDRVRKLLTQHLSPIAFVGILATTPINLGQAIVHQPESEGKQFTQLTQAKPCLRYIKLSSVLSYSKQGEPIDSHSYSVSDGTRVYATYFYYRSPKKVVKEMNRRLASATGILSRETLSNEKGQKSGVRVVAKFESRKPGREFEMLWKEGSYLKVISGPSITHLLQFLKSNCSE